MIVVEAVTWALRAFGLLYFIGGVFGARQAWFWARITPSVDQFMRVAEEFTADVEGRTPNMAPGQDRGRPWWTFSGALILAAAGLAMLFAHRISVVLLSAIIVHQLLYFLRQRRRELAATSPERALEERPNRATINGFFAALVLAVIAAWLYHEGALI